MIILCPENSTEMKKAVGPVSRTFKTIDLKTVTRFIYKGGRVIKTTSSRGPKSFMPTVTVIHFCPNFVITVAKRFFGNDPPTGKGPVPIILLFQQNPEVAIGHVNILRPLATFSLAVGTIPPVFHIQDWHIEVILPNQFITG